MGTYSKVMIRVWAVIAVATLFFAAYKIGQTSLEESAIYLAFPFGSGVMAYLRYYTHKRLSNHKRNDE